MKKIGSMVASFLAVGIILGMLGCAASALNSNYVPLPADININLPDPSIGRLAQFSGFWSGRWNSNITAIIVFEKIDLTGADTIYSSKSVTKGDEKCSRIKGKVKNPSTIVLEDEGRIITFTLSKSGREIYGEWQKGASIVTATFIKISPSSGK